MRKLSNLLLFCFLCGFSCWANAAIILGNTDGQIVLTEFYDYQCPHCHRMDPVMNALIQQNQDLTVAFNPVGVLDNTSVIEAGLAMVSAMQTPYFMQYHTFLMQHAALRLNDLVKLAKALQLTTPQAKQALLSDAVQYALKDNVDKLQQLLLKRGGEPDLIQIPVITLQLKNKPQTLSVFKGEVSLAVLQHKINVLRG